MKTQFVLPNILTTFGLTCGLFIIFRMNMIAPGFVEMEHLRSGLLIILLAAFIDTIDGALARAMKGESAFGGFFDSMSDAIVFGVAPSVLMMKTISPQPSSFLGFVLVIGAMAFSVAGVLRLVRFSTMPVATNDPIKKTAFVGLPITAAGVALTSLIVCLSSFQEMGISPLSHEMYATLSLLAAFFLGYLMVSRWRFPSLKAVHFRFTSAQLLLVVAALASVVLFLLLYNFILTCTLFSWGYILSSWLRALYYFFLGRRDLAIVENDKESEE
jgi:CDP-diacylglycerol--serine O-phosphatidyltransferase